MHEAGWFYSSPRLGFRLRRAEDAGRTILAGEAEACLLEGQFQLRLGRSVHAMALAFIVTDGATGDKRLQRQLLLRPAQVTTGRTTEGRRKNNVVSGLNHRHN